MRATILLIALLTPLLANAGGTCDTEYLSADDRAIMASVLPAEIPSAAATQFARQVEPRVLWSMADPYGRLSADDLSQIQSVQPEGPKVIYCLTSQPRRN
jgi:hypothetical protein